MNPRATLLLQMPKTLYLASTPLHTFFALGLMEGPFREHEHVLALVDQAPGRRDYLADALEAGTRRSNLSIVRFPVFKGVVTARRQLRELSDLARRLAPSVIAVGNDRRLEFHAAARGCPGARRTYMDDGLYSYLPHRHPLPAWREALHNFRRSLKYGLPAERPSMVGASRAIDDAFVLLPDQVHEGLRAKPVHALSPEWFAASWIEKLCIAAASLAGMDATQCASVRLLLLLPHPDFLRTRPDLRATMERLAHEFHDRGETVMVKSHPRAASTPVRRQLDLPADGVIDVPAALAVETLVPLLRGALVVSTLTTALLSLRLLGRDLTVRSLVPAPASGAEHEYNAAAMRVYESVGIRPLAGQAAAPA